MRLQQASRAHRISVAMFGALPCISSPTLKTLAATHVTPHAAAEPDRHRQRAPATSGGGVVDARRIIIAKRVHRRDEAERDRERRVRLARRSSGANIQGAISTSITGVMSDCASRISLTAAPTALKTAANSK